MSGILWEPAIYEHKAALIGKGVCEVARSAELLAEAVAAEFRAYRADLITIGVDVYNIEAEACGCEVISTGRKTCPEISRPLFDLEHLPRELDLPAVPGSGRFRLLLNAGRTVADKLAGRCSVRVAAGGPMSIAAKLVGLEQLITGLAMREDSAPAILEFATCLAERWCRCLGDSGLAASVFDSVAAPPLVSPAMYAQTVLPLHRRIMSVLESAGQTHRPLIIGGDTTAITADLAGSGATVILCDFPADARAFSAALPSDRPLWVRRNVDPRIGVSTDVSVAAVAGKLKRDLNLFARPIAGTGILPYDTDPERIVELRELLGSTLGEGF